MALSNSNSGYQSIDDIAENSTDINQENLDGEREGEVATATVTSSQSPSQSQSNNRVDNNTNITDTNIIDANIIEWRLESEVLAWVKSVSVLVPLKGQRKGHSHSKDAFSIGKGIVFILHTLTHLPTHTLSLYHTYITHFLSLKIALSLTLFVQPLLSHPLSLSQNLSHNHTITHTHTDTHTDTHTFSL